MWEPSGDRSDCAWSCSLFTSWGANMSSCDEHTSGSSISSNDQILYPDVVARTLPSLLPALLELVSLVDWVRSMERRGRCFRTSGDGPMLPPLDRLDRSPW